MSVPYLLWLLELIEETIVSKIHKDLLNYKSLGTAAN